mmetsp:Transcript_8211/g.21648  ORF Transcript_8211/g.21648 Transcript_8211/m.21648 type:complete len:205 (-) Transcript_8211:652-1266(-)
MRAHPPWPILALAKSHSVVAVLRVSVSIRASFIGALSWKEILSSQLCLAGSKSLCELRKGRPIRAKQALGPREAQCVGKGKLNAVHLAIVTLARHKYDRVLAKRVAQLQRDIGGVRCDEEAHAWIVAPQRLHTREKHLVAAHAAPVVHGLRRGRSVLGRDVAHGDDVLIEAAVTHMHADELGERLAASSVLGVRDERLDGRCGP